VEILLPKFTNEAKARVPTLSLPEQADTFAVGEQEYIQLQSINNSLLHDNSQ